MKKLIIVLVSICLANLNGYSQYDEFNFRNMQAPNTAGMIQSNFSQVSPYTGKANVAVPLYTISSKGMDMPVSVNYNTSGILVNDHPGWVGQNWNLNVGGVITRKVEGLADEFGFDPENPSENIDKRYPYFWFINYFADNDMINLNSTNELRDKITDIIEELFPTPNISVKRFVDTEPDIFSFNVNGLSGEFFLGHDGEWKVRSDHNIKVEMDYKNSESYTASLFDRVPFSIPGCQGYDYYDVIYGFKLYDDQGNIYTFGLDKNAIEFSLPFFKQLQTNSNDEMQNHWTANSWKITKIENLNNEQLFSFEYDRGHMIGDFYQLGEGFFSGGNYDCIESSPGLCIYNEANYSPLSGTLRAPNYLKKIETIFNEQIVFNRSKSVQLDFNWHEFSIEAHPNYKASLGSCPDPAEIDRAIYPFLLTLPYYPELHSYASYSFNPLSNNPIDALSWDQLNSITISHGEETKKSVRLCYSDDPTKRLRLNKITISPNLSDCNYFDEEESLTYKFDYNSNYLPSSYIGNPTFLYSEFTDHWGYYNGLRNEPFILANFNSNYFPCITPIPTNPNSYISEEFITTRNSIFNKREILEKITFPTGGYQTFDYEGHSAKHFLSDDRQSLIPIYNAEEQHFKFGLVGGLRIKEIKLFDVDGEELSSRSYKYGDGGILAIVPKYVWFNYESDRYIRNTNNELVLDCDEGLRRIEIRQNAVTSLRNLTENHIVYPFVTEVYADGSSKSMTFRTHDDPLLRDRLAISNTEEEINPLTKFSDLSFLRGKLTNEIIVDANGNTKKETINKYRITNSFNIGALHFNTPSLSINQFQSFNSFSHKTMAASTGLLYHFKDYMTQSVVKDYESGVFVETTHKYDWGTESNNTNEYKFLVSSSTSSTNGLSKETTFKYPKDISSNTNSGLLNKHALNIVLESNINGFLGGGYKKEYGYVGTNLLPQLLYTANEDGTWKEKTNLLYDDNDTYPDRVKYNDRNHDEKLTWGINNKIGLTELREYQSRIWDFEFDDFRQLESITNNEDLESIFGYDGLQRLNYTSMNNGSILNNTTYNIGLIEGGENIISSNTTFPNGGPTMSIIKKIDGLGRLINEDYLDYLDGGTDLKLNFEYDNMLRLDKTTDPRSGGTSISKYYPSPLNQIESVIPPGSPKSIYTNYQIEDNQYVVVTTDENGNETKTYTDIFGRTTKTVDAMVGETSYTYNDRDQVLTIQPPLGEPYVYTYYPDGLLHTKTIPDKGTHTYVYNQYDQIDTETLPNGKTITYVYDAVYNDFLRQIILDGQVIKTIKPYDIVKGWIGSEETAIFGPAGSIIGTHKVEYSDFDYDFGRPQLETISTLEGTVINKLVYDDAGNLTEYLFNVNGPGESVTIGGIGSYLPDNRMKAKGETINGFGTSYSLEFNGNDWLTKKDLGIQTLDYKYNPRGWLTHINSVTDATDENPTPCEEPELPDPPGFDIDCDTLLDIVTTVLIQFDCIRYNESGGNIEIGFTRQYFDDGQRVGIESQTFSTLEGGGTGDFEQEMTFTLGEDANNENFGAGIINILLDCIENNPNFLYEINDILNQINGGSNGGGQDSGEDEEDENESTPTNNKEDVFGMQLHYFDGNSELSASPQYNGNISWMEWNIKGEKRQAYGFRYDANNRLLNAQHGLQSNINPCDYDMSDQYTVSGIGYDALGNIESLQRKGLLDPDAEVPMYGTIDMLTYNYETSPSLLSYVTDGGEPELGFKNSSASYGYDNNGNLISDSGKGISNIIYTYNDLPLHIQTDKGVVKNYYTADGLKVKSVVISTEEGPDGMVSAPVTTNYIGQAEYENGKLKSVYHDEGRIVYGEQGSPYREFFMKDHLGNTRVRIADKNNDSNVEVDYNDPENDELMDGIHYYPFGMQWDTPNFDFNDNSLEPTGAKTKYTYNGKEMQDDLGIDLYYYGFRMYDPAIARFTSVDPIADDFAFVSGFNYAENEPVGSIDLHGLQRLKVTSFGGSGGYRTSAAPGWMQKTATAGAAAKHPIAAVNVGKFKSGSTNISSVSSRISRHVASNGNNLSKGIGSERNALRHTIWSAAINQSFGSSSAETLTNSHEGIGIAQSASVNMNLSFEGDMSLADDVVDFLNNEIGRSISEEGGGLSVLEISMDVLETFKNDGLFTASTDKKGNVTIQRSKISQKQYGQALRTLHQLTDNGFSADEQKDREKK